MSFLVRIALILVLAPLLSINESVCEEVALGPSGAGTAKANGTKPNIVFILADDLGFRDVGYQGSDIYTPVIDELAASGVKLGSYYVQQTCSPTRSQLLTGRYQIHMGVQHGTLRISQVDGLPLQYPTMADILKGSGYSTHALGKWHLGMSQKEYTPLYRGFDTFLGILTAHSDHYNYISCDATFTKGKVVYEPPVDFGMCGYSLYDQETPALEANGTYSAHLYTERATQIIKDSATSDKPFFMYLAYQVPHDPTQAPQSYFDKYKNIVNNRRREYAGMIGALDEGIGKVVQALKDGGLWDNTILAFSSDNGGKASYGASNWPLRGEKSTLWEGGVRSLGFVVSPLLDEKRAGSTTNGLMHVSDWLPTLAEAVGVSLDNADELDGVSQWAMISEGKQSKRTEILHTIDSAFQLLGSRLYNNTFDNRQQAAIRVGDYKLLTGQPGDGNWYQPPDTEGYKGVSIGRTLDWNPGSDKNIWLFNIADDPNELIDLSDTMPDKVRELLDRLAEYEAGTVPPIPLKSDQNADPANFGGIWTPWIQSE